MKLLPRPAHVRAERRGAALMLSFMVLLVLVLILAQIKYSTATADRVARNEETLVAMDSAIESGMLQVFEDLKSDAASDSAGAAGAAGGDAGGALGGGGGGGGAGLGGGTQDGTGGGQDSGPTDSKEDAWAKAQRTEIDEIQLRILIQDEDSKFNVLSVLTEDEEESEKAVDRLARVIEWARKGTKEEIDGGTARRMAVAMTEYMRRRRDQVLPKPMLLSDVEGEDDVGLPLSLREFQAIDPEVFTPDLFRDFIDEEGDVVHSLGSFLTVWSSIGTLDDANAEQQQDAGNPGGAEPGDTNENAGDGAGDAGSGNDGAGQGGDGQGGQAGGGDAAQGGDAAGGGGTGVSQGQGGQGQGQAPPGWGLNLNTTPGAVLHALMDNRDVPYRFWDEVVLYRNEKDDTVEENEDPPLDEYGREIVVHKFFHSVGDLAQVDGWENLEPIVQGELTGLLKTQSQVFSIFITARKPTGDEQIDPFSRQDDIEREEANWNGLVRTVRIVVWRHTVGEGEVEILPIVRWEVLDYSPFEVRDFPESKGYR